MSTLPDFLGSYTLARFIRSGSSCQIWEATKDDGSGRYILKILRREHWGNREQISHLKHEYEVAHRLSHPNVIRILEINTTGKITYLVVELFAELNLKQAMREDPQRLLFYFPKLVEQAASALQETHDVLGRWVDQVNNPVPAAVMQSYHGPDTMVAHGRPRGGLLSKQGL